MLSRNLIQYRAIKCLVCNSLFSDVVYEYRTSLLLDDEKYPITSTLNLCDTCGIIFNNPRLKEETLGWLYNTSYGADTALYGSEELKHLNITRVDFIEKYAGAFRNVIDVGCGGGSLLFLFHQRGKKVYGIEPAADLREYAKANYNLDILSGRLDHEFAEKNDSVYDLVVFNEVLEHVYNPIEFLRFASRITNGFIYFDVPNTLKPRYWNIADFFSCEHLTHFTKYSIRRLAESLGFEVVAIEEDIKNPILKVLLKKGAPVIPFEGVNEKREVRQSFKEYKKKRGQFLGTLKKKLSGVTDVVIYGAGHHSIQMAENGLLEGITIRDIVDSNSKKHGTNFMGHQIKSPNILVDCPYPVVISTFESQEDIANFITKEFPHIGYIKLYSGY